MQKEVWKKIPGYSNYEASDIGRIRRSNDEKVRSGQGYRIVKAGIMNQYLHVRGYYTLTIKRKLFPVSVLVAMAFLNHKPNGTIIVVDHKNNQPLDNRLINLQLISHRENCTKDKFRKIPTSKYIGVHWHKRLKKWAAGIRIKGKSIHLGYFDDESGASKAYQNALQKL